MSKKLTRELIAQKVHSDKIESIRNLNLWGNNLEDISILSQMPSLEVASLSVNKIRTLAPFGQLRNLRELYMRKNMISNLNEIKHLINCENLTTLWLSENPICENKNYRLIVIGVLPQLEKLDDKPITDEEREKAERKLGGHLSDDKDNNDEEEEDNQPYHEETYNDTPNKKLDISRQKTSNFNDDYLRQKYDMEDNRYQEKTKKHGQYNDKYNEDQFTQNKYKKSNNKNQDNQNNMDEEIEEDNYYKERKPKKENNMDVKRFKSAQYNYEAFDENDDENEIFARKPKIGMDKIEKGRKEWDNDNEKIKNNIPKENNRHYHEYRDEYEENKAEDNRLRKSQMSKGNNNILNSVLLLLKELNYDQLQMVKRECGRLNNKY